MADDGLPDLSPAALSWLVAGMTTDEVEAIAGRRADLVCPTPLRRKADKASIQIARFIGLLVKDEWSQQ